jgi:hypothetical protein
MTCRCCKTNNQEFSRNRRVCKRCRRAAHRAYWSVYYKQNAHKERVRQQTRYARTSAVKLEHARMRREAEPDTAFRHRLSSVHGMTIEQYNELLTAQGSVCAICASKDPKGSGTRGRFHVDHDHATGVIRGLLCFECNIGLGKFRDQIDLLQSAISYLTYLKHSEMLKLGVV